MSVDVGQLDLSVEAEGGAPASASSGAPANPDAAERSLRALSERVRRDRERTQAEGYDD